MSRVKMMNDISYTQNRELSWLQFNERVLGEACDLSVPLYERLKFVSIFESNLDEFYMIRVGSLLDLSYNKGAHVDNKSGLTPTEQLKKIFKATAPLYKRKDQVFLEIEKELREHDIYNTTIRELDGKDRKFIDQYFKNIILPVLSPQIVDLHHPFPHLTNKSLHIVVMIKNDEKLSFGFIPVPQSLPNVVFLPGENVRYILMEKIIYEYAEQILSMFNLVDKTIISVTRNADISPEDEEFDDDDDYRHHMKKILKKRKRLAPVRLEIQYECTNEMLDYLCERLNIRKEQVFSSKAPLKMSYVFSLHEKFPLMTARSLCYPVFEPQSSPMVSKFESMIEQIRKKDMIFHYPYEQMDSFLRLVREAANDDNVISIKITIYRLANKAKLVEYLTQAAENKKEVTVLMELRARFDEQNNIDWAEQLEEAGCNVIYGFEGFKVHSKICLITYWNQNKINYITQIGTGNYNEKSAKLYTDLCLITANDVIGNDANVFFKNMSISNLDGQYNQLLVAPTSLKTGISALIDEEIAKVEAGQTGKIVMKMNSLTDRELITKLSEASCAGVKIFLIIRGICCLIPGVQNKTENVTVVSIVGRFLEHSRVYCFGEGEGMQMYISSADIMTRNMEKRVEIASPILDSKVKKRINDILEVQLYDNVKARVLESNGLYKKRSGSEYHAVNSQSYFMEEAIKASKLVETKHKENSQSEEIHLVASTTRFGRLLGKFRNMIISEKKPLKR